MKTAEGYLTEQKAVQNDRKVIERKEVADGAKPTPACAYVNLTITRDEYRRIPYFI